MSQIKLDENTKAVLGEWVARALEAERVASHARETVASILRIVAPGYSPDSLKLDARTMTLTVVDDTPAT